MAKKKRRTAWPSTPASVPQWVLGLATLSAGGMGGYTLAESDESPAVLRESVDLLRSDLKSGRETERDERTALKAELAASMTDLKVGLKEVRDIAQEGARDRFTRTDHQEWVLRVYDPDRARIHDLLVSHAAAEGHPIIESRVDTIEALLGRGDTR